jgi:hypothetical protein
MHAVSTGAAAMTQLPTSLGVPESAIAAKTRPINTRDDIPAGVCAGTGQVTSAYHMPRAMQLAARGGLNTMAFPDRLAGALAGTPPLGQLATDHGGAGASAIAIWEYIALAFDYRAGGITR